MEFPMTDSIYLFPERQPVLRVVTRLNDANPSGDIFGGWLMSQIDIAGAIAAAIRAKGPIATVAVSSLRFIQPLFPHDCVSFYADVTKVGSTSLTVAIDVFAQRAVFGVQESQHPLAQNHHSLEAVKIADAVFVYVAVSEPGKKRLVPAM
jgi:acyl-CoA thioesterase YciA